METCRSDCHYSTEQNIANAVYDTPVKWDIVNRFAGMSFETTSHNTGADNGAATLLEEKIG